MPVDLPSRTEKEWQLAVGLVFVTPWAPEGTRAKTMTNAVSVAEKQGHTRLIRASTRLIDIIRMRTELFSKNGDFFAPSTLRYSMASKKRISRSLMPSGSGIGTPGSVAQFSSARREWHRRAIRRSAAWGMRSCSAPRTGWDVA